MIYSNRALNINHPVRMFSSDKGPGGDQNEGGQSGGNNDGYISDEEGGNFESDKKFNNYILFGGAMALAMCLLASNVM